MSENRKQILEMLSSGRINTDEAEGLLAALETENQPSSANGSARNSGPLKYLRVVVDAADPGAEGPTKVNVRVPLQLLRAGVRLAGLIPAQALHKANDALREQGVPIDLSQVKPENLEELIEQLHDLSIDVDAHEKDGKVNVRVFCE
jgi:SHOCT-like protein